MEQCAVGKIFWEFIIYCVVYRGHMHSDFHICGLCFEQVPVSRETGFRDFRIVYAIDAGSFISAAYLYHDGQILTYATFGIPFSIWMMRSYFDTIPNELAEAGQIDGCSRMGTFFRIVLPLAAPGIAATAMYIFILAWNEVLFATVLTNETTRTYAIGLREFEKQYTKDYGQLMAASIIVSAPIVALFFTFQKLIVSGLTGGSVKE